MSVLLTDEVLEEILMLDSIYEDCWQQDEARPSEFICKFQIDELITSPPQLRLKLQEGYPDIIPVFSLEKVDWLSSDLKHQLLGELEGVCVLGTQMLFSIVEHAKEFFLENEKVRESLVAAISQKQEPVTTKRNNNNNDNGNGNGKEQISTCTEKETNDAIRGKNYEDEKCPKIITGEPFTVQHSVFLAHVAHVTCSSEVKLVLEKLYEKPKIARATHNMYAYRIKKKKENGEITMDADCDDDGEAKAGGRLAHLLHVQKCENVLVVVSRWFGGVKLGPDRFKYINNVARAILVQEGYVINTNSSNSNNKRKK